mmetsp:Transcript_30446/g.49187  ORF Transcript_30446/g.49187 Transcript_30446/m.49187 type:complete len:485 (+) Transcript_30446:228-1682(+)
MMAQIPSQTKGGSIPAGQSREPLACRTLSSVSHLLAKCYIKPRSFTSCHGFMCRNFRRNALVDIVLLLLALEMVGTAPLAMQADVLPRLCPRHCRVMALQLRGGGDDGMAQMLDVLPASVRGLVDALDRKGNGDDSGSSSDGRSHTESEAPARRRPGAAVEHSKPDSDTSQEEYDSNVPLPEPTEGDYQEAQAMDKVLEKWKQNMEERAKNPRIALMEHPKWKWFQEVEKFQNESVHTLQEFEEKLQLHNSTLLSHPLVMKLQELYPRNLDGADDDDDAIPEANLWSYEEKMTAYDALVHEFDVAQSLLHGKYWLLSQPDLDVALIESIVHGSEGAEVIRDLLLSGANPTTPLDPQVMGPIHIAVHLRRHAYIDELVSFGASVNAKRGDSGETPLMRAALVADTLGVKKLVGMGAVVNAQDASGCSALHFAAGSGHLDVAAALLDLGAKMQMQDKEGQTPLTYAQNNQEKEVVEFLESRALAHT